VVGAGRLALACPDVLTLLVDVTAAQSGYRVLASNGRLEADLLDRLSEALGVKTGEVQEPAAPTPSVTKVGTSAASDVFSAAKRG
jgi:hypothetical protein